MRACKDLRLWDENWLRIEYVDRRRSIPDIARELGISRTPVDRALGRYGIPIRAIGTDNVHGQTGTPTWESWNAIHKRCDYIGHKAYARYGGRGITLCEGWRGSQGFLNFLADMGERPEGLTLDRVRNDDGYWCGHCSECVENGWEFNCRWADWVTQNNNRRSGPSAPRECSYCGESVIARGYSRHEEICERNLQIARRFAIVRSRRTVAKEFGVSEQIVKRANRRYRDLVEER